MSLCPSGAIDEFLEDLGSYKPKEHIISCNKVVELIRKYDEPIIFRIDNKPYTFISNLVAARGNLYRALRANNDKEAYERLMRAVREPGRLVYEDFNKYFQYRSSSVVDLPAIRFYERDGGEYISSSMFVACSDGICNASIHRIMVNTEQNYAAARIVPRHLYTLLREKGSLPVAISIGTHPLVLLAAAMSPPLGFFELNVAASLLGGCMRVCKTPYFGLPVPCGSSLVVEAVLGPERRREGPFVDLLQLYDRVRDEPALHVKAIYTNKVYTPLIHAILPGGYEHMILMGFPREAAIYEAVSRAIPRVHKVRLTRGGGMWLHAVVSIEKTHDGDGKTAAFAALAAHPSLKHVIVVDEDIDPDDPWEVEWAIATRVQADRDVVIIRNSRGSTLDPSAEEGLTAKMIIDATAPLSRRKEFERPRS